jgi:hypothetical protein
MLDFYTSRSAVEAYNNCHRYRYLQYHLYGTGIVGKARSVPLVSGSTIHRGVEVLLNQARIQHETNKPPDVDHAVAEAIKFYDNELEAAGFSGKNLKTDRQQWYTYCEQKALTEALIRVWHARELPRILERYIILGVEREIEPLPLAPSLFWQSRVDAEFKEIASGDFHNYSLKSVAMWNEQSERSYKSDLQGVTEIWGVEEDYKRVIQAWNSAIKETCEIISRRVGGESLLKIADYLTKKKPTDKRVMGVRFCFLVKGKRRLEDASDPESLKVTDSPLIRGYKFLSPGGIAYAHSWYYPNPSNRSGKGALGKGWEKFNIWESDISIKRWIEVLDNQELQPECGDILSQIVVTPPEYFRDPLDITETMMEVKAAEQRIASSLDETGQVPSTEALVSVFSRNRAHCYWHYGDECEYIPVCWQPEVAGDIMGSGLYQIRTPHHLAEKDELERRKK